MIKPEMKYRFFGKTGIQVSVLGYGNWLNNDKPTSEMEETTYLCMKASVEAGINYFDTAEVYGDGNAEIAMGKALKRLGLVRKDYVISTKIFRCGKGVNDCFLSRKHIIEGLTASLKRLQLDYVDVVFAHRYDAETPMEEICRAFDWVINKGLAFYWGTSLWTPEQIMEAHECCERLGLIKPVVEQPEYSMLVRNFLESDYVPFFEKTGLATTIWSPLAGGLLSGKYNSGKEPIGSRYEGTSAHTSTGKFPNEFFVQMIRSKYIPGSDAEFIEKSKKLEAIAKELGCSEAQLALAWCIANRDVSVCLFGASKAEQVTENAKSVEVLKKWTPEVEKRIDDILNNKPAPGLSWRYWKPLPDRRSVSVEFLEPEKKVAEEKKGK